MGLGASRYARLPPRSNDPDLTIMELTPTDNPGKPLRVCLPSGQRITVVQRVTLIIDGRVVPVATDHAAIMTGHVQTMSITGGGDISLRISGGIERLAVDDRTSSTLTATNIGQIQAGGEAVLHIHGEVRSLVTNDNATNIFY